MNEQLVILDFGSQYTQVIARRIRECQVYSTILRFDTPAAQIAACDPGPHPVRGPSSVYVADAAARSRIFDLKIPILGICFGIQIMAQHGGKVGPARGVNMESAVAGDGPLLPAIPELAQNAQVWNCTG